LEWLSAKFYKNWPTIDFCADGKRDLAIVEVMAEFIDGF